MTHLTRKKLLSWLESKPADAYVGRSMKCKECPLALFLAETYGGRWHVSFHQGEPRAEHDDGGRLALPHWAADFMRRVDGLAIQYRAGDGSLRLTAGMVLEATRDLLEEEEAAGTPALSGVS